MTKIVIFEDSEVVGKMLALFCKKSGFEVVVYEKPSNAINNLKGQNDIKTADLIISDFDMIDETALNLLSYIQEHNIKVNLIVNSGNHEAENLINKNGFSNLVKAYTGKALTKAEIAQYAGVTNG